MCAYRGGGHVNICVCVRDRESQQVSRYLVSFIRAVCRIMPKVCLSEQGLLTLEENVFPYPNNIDCIIALRGSWGNTSLSPFCVRLRFAQNSLLYHCLSHFCLLCSFRPISHDAPWASEEVTAMTHFWFGFQQSRSLSTLTTCHPFSWLKPFWLW